MIGGLRAFVYRDAAQLLLDHMDEAIELAPSKTEVAAFKFMSCSAIFAQFGLANGRLEEGLTMAEEVALQSAAASHVEVFATYFSHSRWRHGEVRWEHDAGFWNGPITEENQTLRIMCLLAMAEIVEGRAEGALR